MTRRRKRTSLQRAALFERHKGICWICGLKIGVGEAWEVEHVIALEISRDDSDDNLAPAHVGCHKSKTAEDAGKIAKAKRVRAKHIGAHKPKSRLPGSKDSPWKAKIGGGWERRDT